ncbi:MAG: universal stress protein [Ignavibacteria bacterium]|nr:universal stress protein [Ignavibacteria bacterium]MBI3766430.1 universal stress protein [Ignavibacteriales bacterium]
MKLKSHEKGNKPAPRGEFGIPSGQFRLQRILVPIDFSQYSKNALQYAISMAKQFTAELILIYVVEPTVYPADFSFGQVALPTIENELRERGKEELEELIKTHIASALPARAMVRDGKPFLEIINAAAEENVDLIVIATHGHTGVEHLLFGGTAEKVVRKAPCPVLVVRATNTGSH